VSKSSVSTPILNFHKVTQHTFAISDSIALRVYFDTKPFNMKIADLQKGVILVHYGVDVVGEGTGFGVPILKYSDETVFSGSSSLHVHKQGNQVTIRKEFFMDLVERDGFRNLKLENKRIRSLINKICVLYQRHNRLARAILLAKCLLFKIGVKPSFIKKPSKGKVIVTYTITKNRIVVKLNFSLLNRNNLEKVFVMNEQGAQTFKVYSDSDGLKLINEEIDAWNNVTAQSAKITDYHDRIGFNLKSIEGSILRRGRELMRGSLDWIGLDYELSPEKDLFEYEIKISGDSIK
jgi:hypothetical protein